MYPAFQRFRAQVNQAKGVEPFVGTLIALDPGETTGVAVFHVAEDGTIELSQGQLKTWPFSMGCDAFLRLFRSHFASDGEYSQPPKRVVHEAYKIYEWKTSAHGWSEVPTLQLIGCVKTILQLQHPDVPSVVVQTAQVAKNFCTDENLRAWNMYDSGMRHARDAVRHGTYFLLFGPSEKQTP